MMPVNSPWRAVRSAELHWSDTGTPVSDTYADVYYSQDDGLQESRHVFLAGNDLPRRWHEHPRPHFCVGELGFGTGLNFLLTWQLWQQQPEPRPDLHFLSIEQHPLTRQDLARALAQWPALQALAAPLLAAYPGLLPGQHRILLDAGRVRLDLWWGAADAVLADLAGRQQALMDAWYLDGFAPARNASMWTAQVLAAVAALSHPQASCATFTAAGHVRRTLAEAGFRVSKVPGFGRKRESLRAVREGAVTSHASSELLPWDLPAATPPRPTHALVLGGGLAGSFAAAALARRGIAITLLERDCIASAGSGNEQGILYTRLARQHSALVDFSLQAFQFAANGYRNLFDTRALATGRDGALCGNFQQSEDAAELAAFAQLLPDVEELAQVVSAETASALLGIRQDKAGYWFPRSGWLHPPAVCRALQQHPAITVRERTGPVTLQHDGEQWRALAADGRCLASAPCAIAATGTDTAALQPFQWLPLQVIRGQTTLLPATPASAALRATLCHDGFIAPARAGRHCIGATFAVGSDELAARADDSRDNLRKLAAAVPAWAPALQALDAASLPGRVGLRCASPDYLPVVGPAPDYAAFLEDYAGLRRNAKLVSACRGKYLPGLYLSTAHGSRGLTSTPLAAELLASVICAEPAPLSRALGRALSPARFIIRGLIRNRLS